MEKKRNNGVLEMLKIKKGAVGKKKKLESESQNTLITSTEHNNLLKEYKKGIVNGKRTGGHQINE